MPNDFIAKSTITIQAPVAVVWDALTNPEIVKQYLFGTQVTSDWQVGSSITYRGEWKGKAYEDKGTIVAITPEKYLETTYWSSMSGEKDIPANYKKVVYELAANGGSTTLTISNDHNATEEARSESQKNWDMVLATLKGILEN